MTAVFKVGDVFDRMSELEDGSVDLVLTSPPFGWLRSYLPADHPDKHREIGQEATPADYLDVLLRWTAECRRVLAPHGSLAVELGDSFAGAGGAGGDYDDDGMRGGQPKFDGTGRRARSALSGWPLAKSLVGVPQLYMLSLAYGRNILTGTESPAGMWRVRNVKPWIRCLDTDTNVYVRTPTGDRPMRLLHLHQQFALGKFQLWTGEQWTDVTETVPSDDDDAIEIEFRTGERIACTRGHRWPVESILGETKLLRADELTVGDVVRQVQLPDTERTEPAGLPDDDIGWLCGVFLGDGSFDTKGRIQISGHQVLDADRARRLTRIADTYDGTWSIYEHGDDLAGNVVIRSHPLAAVMRYYIGGDSARNKHLAPAAWRRSNAFLHSLLMGYLESDGHYDEPNNRWRLGFTDNPWLARDLRTIAARVGASCIVRRWRAGTDPRGGHWSGSATHRHRGEIRFGHKQWWSKQRGEIVAIRETKRRSFIDVAVADEPHLFALASGLLTHNTNPPVGALGDKERPATSYVIVACTSANRWFDLDAVRTPAAPANRRTAKGVDEIPRTGKSADRDGNWSSLPEQAESAGAPPRDWWHQVDAIIDAEIDRMAKQDGETVRAGGGGPKTVAKTDGMWSTLNPVIVTRGGARGVHIRRALEDAGILTTLEALDISPKGYSGAHYAVWPPELCRQLIDEMCPRRVCVMCGEPSRRIVGEATYVNAKTGTEVSKSAWLDGERQTQGAIGRGNGAQRVASTLGWSDCGCEHCICTGHVHHGTGPEWHRCCLCNCNRIDHYRPGLVLDPFAGSGTTLAVASGMGRDSIGIDLDPRNADLARERVGMFLEIDEREVSA